MSINWQDVTNLPNKAYQGLHEEGIFKSLQPQKPPYLLPAAPQKAGLLGSIRVPSQITEIPGGTAGTEATIKEMKRLARIASMDPQFVIWCRGLVADLPAKDYKAEAKRIHDVVKQHVRYVLDPRGMELVQDPRWVMFVDGSGDCDEQSTLIAAMALALGHNAAFKTVAVDPERPDEFSHVYAMIGVQEGVNEKWYAADTTQKSGYFGWEPPKERISLEKVWPV